MSGLNAASSDLSVTAHNIANVATTGFKGSRSEFADIYAASTFGVGATTPGSGVRLTQIAQQFTQGSIEFTDNSLDLAISGQGFFTLEAPNGQTLFTRAGAFHADSDGYVVNAQSQRLQVYPAASNGLFNQGAQDDLRISNADSPALATTEIQVGLNLPASADEPSVTTFDPADPDSYNQSSSVTAFDSLGVPHSVSLFFIKTATSNEWDIRTTIDNREFLDATSSSATLSVAAATVAPSGSTSRDPDRLLTATLTFTAGTTADLDGDTVNETYDGTISVPGATPNATGFFTRDASTGLVTIYNTTTGTTGASDVYGWELYVGATPADGTTVTVADSGPVGNIAYDSSGAFASDDSGTTTDGLIQLPTFASTFLGSGGSALDLTLDLSDSTQFGSQFSVTDLIQNGYTSGRLTGLEITQEGVVQARYSNGQAIALGELAIANFRNPQGLQQAGDTNWTESVASGDPTFGVAGTGSLGLIVSGGLEGSNVDLTEQLVSMIAAQRNFQANAKMIETTDQVTQTIINIR
ncbi:MAG: flagellar hook protein FlgE [Gammaproteobacteria bacterium]|nr:flagellar hook protein FlgE [Gammaproteobacteria bacterium]